MRININDKRLNFGITKTVNGEVVSHITPIKLLNPMLRKLFKIHIVSEFDGNRFEGFTIKKIEGNKMKLTGKSIKICIEDIEDNEPVAFDIWSRSQLINFAKHNYNVNLSNKQADEILKKLNNSYFFENEITKILKDM